MNDDPRPWSGWLTAVCALSSVLLAIEDRLWGGGALPITLAVLVTPLCGYLVVTGRLAGPPTRHLPILVVVLAVLTLTVGGPAVWTLRPVSVVAATATLALWGTVLVRRRPGAGD